jgi:hypothetical protein
MWQFDPSQDSQAVLRPEVPRLKEDKSPLLAAFCNSAPVSETPKLENSQAISAKVSGDYREYSRFRETRAGDPVRSPLRADDASRLFIHK